MPLHPIAAHCNIISRCFKKLLTYVFTNTFVFATVLTQLYHTYIIYILDVCIRSVCLARISMTFEPTCVD